MTKNSLKGLATRLAALSLALSLSAAAENVRIGAMTVEQPDNWYQAPIPADEPYTRAIFASDSEAGDQGLMMVSIEPAKGRSLDALSSATRNFIVTQMDGVVEYERPGTVDGLPAYTFVYEGRSEHTGRRKFMRTVVKKGDSFYILHGVANHVPFAKYAGTMEGIVKSVQWNE